VTLPRNPSDQDPTTDRKAEMTPMASVSLEDLVEHLASRVAARLVAQLRLDHEPGGQAWELLTVDQAAEVLKRSRRWIYDAVRRRGLPYVRLDGGGICFQRDDLRAWADTYKHVAGG
jgi:excisionase family DNA binding protein